MQPIDRYHKELADGNKREYGLYYEQLRKLSYYRAAEADEERNRLLQRIGGRAAAAFNGTKLFAKGLSPGCRQCGEGQWSCLFVNNRCNCNCFYCPAPQIDIGIPETQGLHFLVPKNYVDYIRKLGFKGVSLSGGEPLLTFDTTYDFLKTIKDEFGKNVYLWLYTNGTLLTEEKAEKLAEAGLDEIRFDLSAKAYNTRYLKHAVGKIPHITVEIPAIPEEVDQMKQMAVELDQLGVNYLNLHQMRLTPHNLKNLLHRNYTFLHGPRMTVLESELAALEILRFSIEHGLQLAVNYCSFHYKNHFQKAGFRKKLAPFLQEPFEELTENGYIRRMSLQFDRLANIPDAIKTNPKIIAGHHQSVILTKEQLVNPGFAEFPLFIEYFGGAISETPVEGSHRVTLNDNMHVFISRRPAGQKLVIPSQDLDLFITILNGICDPVSLTSESLFEACTREMPACGFQRYF